MSVYSKTYHTFFEIDEHNPRICELTGRVGQTELHHIDARGMGGSSQRDNIENIMCLIKSAHDFFGDIVKYKEWLKGVHTQFMIDRIPFIRRKINHPFMEAFLEGYAPNYRLFSLDIYSQDARSNIRGYLFGHLGPVALDFFRNKAGERAIDTKEKAVYALKHILAFYDIDEEEEKKVRSIKDAPINQLAFFIEGIYQFLIDNNMEVNLPDVYHKQKKQGYGKKNRTNYKYK